MKPAKQPIKTRAAKKAVAPVEVKSEPASEPEIQAEIPTKEKEVVVEPFSEVGPITVNTENTEMGPVVARRPVVDITGLKHNRFSVIGNVLKALKESGRDDNHLKEARSVLLKEGGDLRTLVDAASKFVEVRENGLPFTMESGLATH